MKRLKKIASLILILGLSYSVDAQNTATASSTATIVAPLTIVQNSDLNFGNITASGSSGGTVVLTTSGTRTATGGVTLSAISGTVSAASFTVTGESGYTYAISLPADITLVHSLGLAVLLADNLQTNPSLTGTLTSGTDVINLGATLNVNAGQMQGFYSGSFDVTVNYN